MLCQSFVVSSLVIKFSDCFISEGFLPVKVAGVILFPRVLTKIWHYHMNFMHEKFVGFTCRTIIFVLFSKNNLLIYGMIPDYLPEIPSGLTARLVRVYVH